LSFFDEQLGEIHHLIQYEQYRTHPDREFTVPDRRLLVMGDNRDNSSDGRDWGYLPMDNIKGKAMFVWLSCGRPDVTGTGPLDTVREFLSPVLPCDGYWLDIRWRRFGHWIE
jgi:hypothetical protein